MKFTDDHLKWLKDIWDEKALGGGCDCMDYATAQALLARLEAAENVIKAWEDFSMEIHSRVRTTKKEFELRMNKANATQAWRTSKGEGDGE